MIEIAKRAALEAGRIALKRRFARHSIERKGSADNFATESDFLCQQKILEILQSKFSKHNYRSEEKGGGNINNGSEFTWVIDPIDGTGPYFSGLPTFGISVGLLKGGKPFLGVLNFPALDSIYWAEEGRGAFLNRERIRVIQERDLRKVMVGFDLGWMGEREEEIRGLILPLADRVRYTPILGCTIAGLAYVAQGVYGAYLHWAYPWDFAAGAAIIGEAGGKITDYEGREIDWTKDDISVLASNGLIHDEIIKLIKK